MDKPVQAEHSSGDIARFSTTPQGVELLRSSDIEEAFIPRAALRLHGVFYVILQIFFS
jgi:hypothetical protein